jgi:hypothetical protein
MTAAALMQFSLWRPDAHLPDGVLIRLVVVPLLVWWGALALRLWRRPPIATTPSVG